MYDEDTVMASRVVGPGLDGRTTPVALYRPRLSVLPMKVFVLERRMMVAFAPVSGFPEGSLLCEKTLTVDPESKFELEVVDPDRVT